MVDLTVSVPTEVVGDPAAKVRIYLALEGLEPAPVDRRPGRDDEPDDRSRSS